MLTLHHVTAGYGSTTVLRDVRLVVPPGRLVALLGPNGAGKTTLLRVASGLLAPSSGQVLLDGENVTGARPHELQRRGVCHIPEGRGIFPTLTVKENLLMQACGSDRSAAIERAVSAFPRLGERLDQFAGTMSGGEQQMLALARTYVQSPSLVLLDEVSMGLAPKIVDEIYEFLARLAAEGTSMLLVEQYVTRALGLCDYVYLLKKGRVVFAGEPGEVSAADLHAEYVGSH